jgi:hypothetical protein
VGIVIVAVFVLIAVMKDDPHWINRGGAFLAACAAVAVLKQTFLEERRRHVGEAGAGTKKIPLWSPFGRWMVRQDERALTIRLRELDTERVRIIFVSAVTAVVGEVLHGFGDLIYIGLHGLLTK